ncbi:uncharacterized protein LOC131669035 isoform X2 [Phymastichus coffea]|uniref:uncharacterized protein LOC131669035 isoform X2 n=1 Tax=Phymastichus coffea TaxID=108790 RepID=UPI00273BE710|nr:uncharacterized protein LOC131669035 isoform X2 [Phymastichus coffea]
MSGFFSSLRSLASGAHAGTASRYDDDQGEDMRMRFSLTPQPGESGFNQWLDAMKMVAKLQGGIPAEFRKKLWLTLAERHLEQRGINWQQAEKLCFNEWSNPDDEELGIQIVKDLHRTGCSLFCGAAGRDNQAVLRRVLLGYARWNKSVGYCQGLNVLAALILQVVDRDEAGAVKVMIYLIEGVLPEGYFADSLRGLSVDMAVFRDLLRMRVPRLSRHLESLQNDPKDKATGSSYEPPLTNVFTMQWFLTLFCHCLPQDVVLRVWDLIFLEGNDVLLRTALAIWEGISDRIMTVTSADEFYSIMGVLTREMLEFTDTNNLIKTIVAMGPLTGITNLREKHRYNITPWARRLSDDEDSDTEDDDRLAVATAATIFSSPRMKRSDRHSSSMAPSNDRERLALDISTLKQQYAKLRERQRQAHIILSAACTRQTMNPSSTASQAMNHLLVGKSALVSSKGRSLSATSNSLIARAKAATLHASVTSPRSQRVKERQQQQQGVTIHWKDMKKRKDEHEVQEPAVTMAAEPEPEVDMSSTRRQQGTVAADSDSDSTSTELCDEPDRLSDLDSEEPTSISEGYAITMAEDDEAAKVAEQTEQQTVCNRASNHLDVANEETSIAEITDQIRRLSADDADFKTSLDDNHPIEGTIEVEITELSYDKPVKEETKVDSQIPSVLNNESVLSETPRTKVVDITSVYDYSRTIKSRVDDVLLSAPTKTTTKSSYVIGHLPISPASYEARNTRHLSELSPSTELAGGIRERFDRNTFSSSLDSAILISEQKFSSYKLETKRSPRTPESAKSFSSGETMGPDSVISSVAASPKTPLRSDSRDFTIVDKSSTSSASSESKTLTMRSIDSEAVKVQSAPTIEEPGDTSMTPLSDSLMQPKSTEPPCSSTESFFSPTKLKSSERSFSSELQSPVSANSIKYTANYSFKSDLADLKPSSEIGPVISPFYPILNPNHKTPSPLSEEKRQIDNERGELEYKNNNQNYNKKNYSTTKTPIQAFDISQLQNNDDNPSIKISDENDTVKSSLRKLYSYEFDDDVKTGEDSKEEKNMGRTSAFEVYRRSKFEEELKETDTLSPLPNIQFENRNEFLERSRGRSLDGKLETLEVAGISYDRSSSSLEKRFPGMLLSPSMEDFANNAKKRSSDVLEDLKHFEAKTMSDGEIDPNMLTRKSSCIWEDLKNLEARRQDTFSDSVSGFSRQKIEVPGICISSEHRKTYIVEPKINIDDNSDSILKTVVYKNGNLQEDDDDNVESKLGVWTKVKPRKRNDNGRRSSDRALKIIQENSAILQKILTCQARKRLPDLEEISKQITISPINEEISKIFSPILEKMGFNEHEINEELARINFKDLDRNTTTTTASEFEAKINEELSKLSLVGDNDEVAYLPDVEDLSSDYLVHRDAFIDRQINKELSKLISHYDVDSPMALQKGSSSIHVSDDLSTCSTNVYSYKSSDDSLDINDLGSSRDPLHSTMYQDNPLPYVPRNDYSTLREFSTKRDVDIYRDIDKLNQISYTKPPMNTETRHPDVVPISVPYISDVVQSPKIDYPSSIIEKQTPNNISPLKSPYDSSYSSTLQASSYDYKLRLSPRKIPNNPYSVRSYDAKNTLDTGFENSTFEFTSRQAVVPSNLNYEYDPKKHILSKEHLEFQVKYENDPDLMITKPPVIRDINLKLSPFHADNSNVNSITSFYPDKQLSSTDKYIASIDDLSPIASNIDLNDYESSYTRRKYDSISPLDKYSTYGDNYDVLHQPYKILSLEHEPEVSSYLTSSSINTSHHRGTEIPSPQYQYCDYSKPIGNSYKMISSNLDNSVAMTTRIKTTYADNSPTDTLSYRNSTLILGTVGETQPIGDPDIKYSYDEIPSPKPLGFSPFPVRNAQRKPKDVALKLGLYSPTNSIQSKRS